MDHAELKEVYPEKVVLVGNPNSGKTSLFNALTGLNQRVGNFPGVTVDRKSATLSLPTNRTIELVDLPGTNSLYPQSEDEEITCKVLKDQTHPDHPDLVVVMADATQLKRGLLLCSQVIDLQLPTLLVINMIDLIKQDDQVLDIARLSQHIGIPTLTISALRKEGIEPLKQQLSAPIPPTAPQLLTLPPNFLSHLRPLKKALNTHNDYLAYQALVHPESMPQIPVKLGQETRKRIGLSDKDASQLLANELLVRNDRAEAILSESWVPKPTFLERLSLQLDKVLVHRVWGYVIFAALLMLIFQAIFKWAEYPMGWIEAGIEGAKSLVAATLPAGWLTDLLTEGIITGFGGVIVFIPQIIFLFFFIALMEESGYMSRVVFLMDRIMRPFGFSGKSIIPLIGGMACAIPSIMMTRTIPNKTERLITLMVTPLMSCSARIPVYTLLIAMFIPAKSIWGMDQRGLFMIGLYLLGFIMALLVAWVFKTVWRYKSDGVFVMEMPHYRMPRWKNVGVTAFQKSLDFVFGAGKIILAISIVLWVLVSFGPKNQFQAIDAKYDQLMATRADSTIESAQLAQDRMNEKLEASFAAHLGKFIEPAIRPLGYDWKIGISLITSFAAREVFVGTMSIIYGQEDPDSQEGEQAQRTARRSLIERLQTETYADTGQPVYSRATVLSLLVFYAFAMQCMSTLAVTKREAGWGKAFLMLAYLSVLAYGAAWIAFQLFS